MTRIEVPSETLVVEMGEDGLNIVETFMQMSGPDDSAQVQCDICSKPLRTLIRTKQHGRYAMNAIKAFNHISKSVDVVRVAKCSFSSF